MYMKYSMKYLSHHGFTFAILLLDEAYVTDNKITGFYYRSPYINMNLVKNNHQ